MIHVRNSEINGKVSSPDSKSEIGRCLALSLLSEGTSSLRLRSLCDDAKAALRVVQALGARTETSGTELHISGVSLPQSADVSCGESGLCLRMFAPIAALASEPIVLRSEGSLQKRPMDFVLSPLRELGALCEIKGGHALAIKGPMRGGEICIDGSISSQFLTGLLIALPHGPQDYRVSVKNLKSKPYVSLTVKMAKEAGLEIQEREGDSYFIKGRQRAKAKQWIIEGDWSGAAFLLVGAALTGQVSLTGLNSESLQADKSILDALLLAQAPVRLSANEVSCHKANLAPFTFDATNCPDLFPPLVALAAGINGESKIKGVTRLRHKESDRAAALQEEFAKIGVNIKIDSDTMHIFGGHIPGGSGDSRGDHRIAMALAIAGLVSTRGVNINNPTCISKSYPDFYNDLHILGTDISGN